MESPSLTDECVNDEHEVLNRKMPVNLKKAPSTAIE